MLHSHLNCKKYCKELKMLCFEMGNCCLNIPHLDAIDYKSHEHEAESKNANKTWPAGMLLWHNANTADASEDEAHLFIEHCLQFSVTPNSLQNNIPSQNLLMIKQTRMISKTEKKISSSCFNILSRSDTASATMLKNLKNIGMQTIHFLAFTKLIS